MNNTIEAVSPATADTKLGVPGQSLEYIGATLCFGAFLAFRYDREHTVAETLADYELLAKGE